ncbi:hypothetical protein [Alkalibacillus haloalkaliphilus]|uniref:hypothetical protein n=1 Tax=Alkalibacillus haloalkaliphilus TaxID=94136 RepID=UPI002936B88B|nr:hypothetical protein [Alkalibacillus haloalkaliphilus]MDV2582463.1 hypothetical protein [Alkalibacillus haloalkaliphilus]
MSIVVYFTLAWLLIGYFIAMNNKMNLMESTVVFLVTVVASINVSWILIEEMVLIQVTEQAEEYISYLLNRSVITPLIVMIGISLMIRSENGVFKAISYVGTVVLLTVVNNSLTYFGVFEFVNWNFIYDIIYFAVLMLIAVLTYKFYHNLYDKEAVKQT